VAQGLRCARDEATLGQLQFLLPQTGGRKEKKLLQLNIQREKMGSAEGRGFQIGGGERISKREAGRKWTISKKGGPPQRGGQEQKATSAGPAGCRRG